MVGDRVGGSGAGGAGISGNQVEQMLAGYARQEWVDSNYVSIEFFGRLFQAYNGTTAVNPNDTTTTIDNIKAMFGFWTEQYLSARGRGAGGGGGGGTGNVTWDELAGTAVSPHKVDISYLTGAISTLTGGTSELANKRYAVQLNDNNQLFVDVPWTDTDHYDWDDITNKPATATRWPAFSEVTGSASASQVPNIENLTNFSSRVYDATLARTANTVLAGPTSGNAAAATVRALVAADIPSLAISKISGLQTALDSKLDIAFFSSLFKAYNGTTEVTPNNSTANVDNIKAMFGFWTEQYLSARGRGAGGGGGGGTGNVTWDELAGTAATGRKVDISYLADAISTLTGYTTSGRNYAVEVNASNQLYVNVPWTDTTYSFSNADATLAWSTRTKIATVGGTDIYVTMPANPNTDHYDWSDITNKPATATRWPAFSEVTGSASASQVPNIENLTNFSSRVYDATLARTANTVLAGPTSGNAAAATFRALVAADIPSLAISKITGLQTALDSKLDIAFFSSLFKAYNGTTEVTPNNSTANVDNIKAMFGFWTEQYLSARGRGAGGGGGGGTGNVTWDELAGTAATGRKVDISYLADAISTLTGYTTSGRNYAVEVNASNQLYVNVPWTDTTYSFSNADATLAWSTRTKIATVGGTDIYVTMPANPNTDHYAWTDITGKPTTIAGYGITDAKIVNGVITLGANTITPLTSHQTVTDNNPTLAWSTKSKVATIGSTDIHVTMPANPDTWRPVVDNLTSTSATNCLSANQGKTLKGYIDTLNGYFSNGVANSAAKLTTVSKTAWGQTFWTANGVPDSISGDMTSVGNITMNNNKSIYMKDSGGDAQDVLTLNSSNQLILGGDTANEGYNTYLRGYAVYLQYSGSNTGLMLNSSGNVGIGTTSPSYKLSVSGDIVATGCLTGRVTSASDIHAKNISSTVLPLSLVEIANAPTIRFKWKQGDDQADHVGSIAQYWQSVMPEVIWKNKEGMLTLEYGTAALISSITIAREVAALKQRIKELERKLKN